MEMAYCEGGLAPVYMYLDNEAQNYNASFNLSTTLVISIDFLRYNN